MPFVPDKPTTGRFVPDTAPPESRKAGATPAPGPTAPDLGRETFGAVLEPIANMATGMLAKPVSEVMGLGATAKELISPSKGVGPGSGVKDFQQDIQNSLTYEPRTRAGKAASEYNPLALLGKAIGWGAEKISEIGGGDKAKQSSTESALRSGAKEAIEQVPALLGAKAGAAAEARLPAKAAALKTVKGENAVLDATRDRVQSAGYITPAETGIKSMLQGASGKARNEKGISIKNADNATRRLGAEVGIPEGVALSDEAIGARKEAQYDRYEALKAAVGPEVTITDGFRTALSGALKEIGSTIDVTPELRPAQRILQAFQKRITPKEPPPAAASPLPGTGGPGILGTIESAAKEQPGAPIMRTIEQAASETPGPAGYGSREMGPARSMPAPSFPPPAAEIPKLSTNFVTKQISDLRRNAKDDFRKGNSDTGMARIGIANSLENLLEENIARTGPKQLADFRDARKQLAQLHFLDRVVNEATGKVDLSKVASLSETKAYKGVLTGEFETAADFAKSYRKAAQKGTGEATPQVSVFDGLFALSTIAAGHPWLGAVELGSRIGVPAASRAGMLQNKTPSYQPGALAKSSPALLRALGIAAEPQQ